MLQPKPPAQDSPLSRARLAGIGFVFLWFFIGGIAHFAATETEMPSAGGAGEIALERLTGIWQAAVLSISRWALYE